MTNPNVSSVPAAAPDNSAPADASAARAAIGAGNAAFMTAFGRGDVAGIAACYTRDAQLLPAQSDVVADREAVEKFWEGALGAGLTGATLETVEVYHTPGGNVATEVGRYALTAGGDQIAERGKYVVIWQQGAEGQWRIHRDIWTSSQPPMATT